MLFLLRKIRRKLLTNNKFGTYVLYAIGEIILVIIGIYIAIQLNNLNEDRKVKLKEEVYYCKLLEDVRQDAIQIDRLINETNNRVRHANTLIGLLQKEKLNPSSISQEMYESVSLVTFTFRPSTSAFEDIKSSGSLGVLEERTKNELSEYYVYIEGIVDVVNINSDHYVHLFQETDSYAKDGWQLIEFANQAFDSTLVDVNQLMDEVTPNEEYRDKMMSDAVYFVASGTRVKILYEDLKVKILDMENTLIKKCKN